MKNRIGRWVLPLTLAAMVLVSGPSSALAQDIPHSPPPPLLAWQHGISIDEHRVRASITDAVANVTIAQVFHNESSQIAEGAFLFPLPENAAVGDFQMTVDGQVIEGQIMDEERARHIYEETVRMVRDPALLEYIGSGLYQTSVFPIPPGETRTLQLNYSVVLDAEEGLHNFTYPIRVPAASRPARHTEIIVELASEGGLRTIYSPTHDVVLDRDGDNRATVRYVAESGEYERNFSLYYGLSDEAIGLSLLTYRPAGEDGYFLLLASPSIAVDADKTVRRDIVFVLDVSGSMEGPKLEQAKDAVRHVVGHLNPGDRFNLVAFSTGVRLWNDRLSDSTPDNQSEAVRWVGRLEASGSTDINRALLEGLAQFGTDDNGRERPAYILFMTDGLPTQGETDVSKIIRNALANRPADIDTRLFAFGVGYDVDTDLLDTVSQQLGGRSRYVRPEQDIGEAVSHFYNTIQTPVLTNVDLDLGDGTVASDILPHPIPDLFAGEQLVVAGRYRRGGEVTVQLSGKVNGEPTTYAYPDRELATAGGEPSVARLWATRKIGTLMDEIRRNGPDPELVDAVVDLSMRYGIVSPYTSYLVQEPDVMAAVTDDTPAEAPAPRMHLFSSARESVAAEAESVAAAPASGEAAVAASEARADLLAADVVEEHLGIRFAGGRAFLGGGSVQTPDGREETLWVDTAYSSEMPLETVEFGGERYFELANHKPYAEILALSPEIIFVTEDGTAVRVTALVGGAADEADGYPPPVRSEDRSLWGQFVDWLSGMAGR